MTIDSQLLLGLVLIAIGIILAVLAYTFLVSRREEGGEPAPPESGAEEAQPSGDVRVPIEPATPPVAAPPAPSGPALSPAPQLSSQATPPAPAPGAPTQVPPPVAAPRLTPVQPASSLRRTFPVATLLRDEVTGSLLVRIGDKEYASPKELKDSRDYSRVEFAAADLARWFGGPPTVAAAARPEAERKEPPKPKSMIEQINEILNRRLAEAPGEHRGLRLMETPGGGLKVLIGLQSYNFDDVPDAEVRRIIREAVAEWEASR